MNNPSKKIVNIHIIWLKQKSSNNLICVLNFEWLMEEMKMSNLRRPSMLSLLHPFIACRLRRHIMHDKILPCGAPSYGGIWDMSGTRGRWGSSTPSFVACIGEPNCASKAWPNSTMSSHIGCASCQGALRKKKLISSFHGFFYISFSFPPNKLFQKQLGKLIG